MISGSISPVNYVGLCDTLELHRTIDILETRTNGVSRKRGKPHDDAVTVLIGEDKTPYIVSKSLICLKSSFFGRVFHNSNYVEMAEREISIEDCSCETFQRAIQWISSSTVNIGKGCDRDLLSRYIDFLVFADYIDLQGSFDTILDEIERLKLSVGNDIYPGDLEKIRYLPGSHPVQNIFKDCENTMTETDVEYGNVEDELSMEVMVGAGEHWCQQ